MTPYLPHPILAPTPYLPLADWSSVRQSVMTLGISPVGFAADPARGIHHRVVIIEVTPAEYGRVARKELRPLGPQYANR